MERTSKIKGRIKYYLSRFLRKIIFSKRKGSFFTFFKLLIVKIYANLERGRSVLGDLWSKPSGVSSLGAFIGISENLNNLGNVYSISDKKLNISQRIEKGVIEWVKDIFNAKKGIEGYVTSGGTEANLYLMWAGRELLGGSKVALIHSDFTHYSVRKAGEILGLREIIVPVSKETWGIAPEWLLEELKALYKKGIKRVLLPLTLGYPSTGAFDPADEIIKRVRAFEKEKKDAKVFIWIDAAMQGLPLAFLKKDFNPFSSKEVQGFVVDFHKLGSTPIPSGTVLYRKRLRSYVEKPIDYLSEDDATLSGSRPASSALSIWANLSSKSSSFWKKHFASLNKEKDRFVEELRRIYPLAKIISSDYSFTLAIAIDKNFARLPGKIEEKYNLRPVKISYLSVLKRQQNLMHYKIHFLPQRKDVYEEFLKEIRKLSLS